MRFAARVDVRAARESTLNIQVAYFQRVLLDEDPAGLDLWFGSAGIEVVAAGAPAAFDERAAAAALREDPVVIRVGLGLGAAEATVWTCDLSADYVAINAHYTT